jgi:prepilin-type N-terminal cleavage/methylation domain-containing protein
MRPIVTLRAFGSRAGKEDGFTLVELLLTMAILLTVIGALTGALVSALNSETNLNNHFQAQTQARQALVKLTREIHCANQIQDGNGSPLTATKVSGMTVTLPAGCPTGGAAAVTVRWCAVVNGVGWDLYRYANGGCGSAGGMRWATLLVNGTPFSLPTTGTTGTHYPLIHVDLKVRAGQTTQTGTYDLVDDIAAFNSTRSASG